MNLSARAHKNLQSALAGALLGGLMASPRVGAAAVLNGLTAFTQGVLPFLPGAAACLRAARAAVGAAVDRHAGRFAHGRTAAGGGGG